MTREDEVIEAARKHFIHVYNFKDSTKFKPEIEKLLRLTYRIGYKHGNREAFESGRGVSF